MRDRKKEEKTRCRNIMGYFCHLALRDLLYPSTHIQDNTPFVANSSLMGPLGEIDPVTQRTLSGRSIKCDECIF